MSNSNSRPHRDHPLAIEHRKKAAKKFTSAIDAAINKHADRLATGHGLPVCKAGQTNQLKAMGLAVAEDILAVLDTRYVVIESNDYDNAGGLPEKIRTHAMARGFQSDGDATLYRTSELVNLSGELTKSFFEDINS